MFLVPLTPASRSASALGRSFECLFDDSFQRVAGCGADGELEQRNPALDVTETERGFRVSIELPGVAKQDVKIDIDGRRVSVSAQAQQGEVKQDGERLIYRERSAAKFARSLTLPEEVDQDASLARLENGVLNLTLAKKRATAARQLAVN